MHRNIAEQRNNWNTHLLNSINMITLTATTITAIASATTGVHEGMSSILALKVSSTLLFSTATGMLVIMNKLQPSQLAEEQRNATRLFKKLQTEIKTTLAFGKPTQQDINIMMDKVLAIDKAYPLPLIGVMLEKLPKKFEPAVWWPSSTTQFHKTSISDYNETKNVNGWSKELEMEMREIIEVVKGKDKEDYERLGNIVLKINKMFAISGPLLSGIAALSSSPFVGNGSLGAIVAVTAGALASAVNTLEHGGQIGMVLEMYRNSGGFFKLMEDSIKATLDEDDFK